MSHTSFCHQPNPSILPHQAFVPSRLGYRRPPLVQDALDLLAIHISEGDMLSSPDAVRGYLRLPACRSPPRGLLCGVPRRAARRPRHCMEMNTQTYGVEESKILRSVSDVDRFLFD